MSNVDNVQRPNASLSEDFEDFGDDHAFSNEEETIQSSLASAASSIITGSSAARKNREDVVSSPSRPVDPIQKLFEASQSDEKGDSRKGDKKGSRSSRSSRQRSSRSTPSNVIPKISNANLPGISLNIEQVLHCSSRSTSLGGSSSAGLGMQTPFEVDNAKGESRHSRQTKGLRRIESASSSRSASSLPTDPYLSEEQDAWAGIDELLESRSLDDSFCFSTTDILPSATVQAMRRNAQSDDETVFADDNTEAGASTASSYYINLRVNEVAKKSNQESWCSKEDRDRARCEADLFGLFTWSEGDNVDEQRARKGKLNNNARKMEMLRAQQLTPRKEADSMSLPSLATFRADDFSVISAGVASLDWSTYHTKEGKKSSLPQANTRDEFGFDAFGSFPAGATISEESFEGDSFAQSSSPRRSQNKLAGDGLVLDKGVDEYIRRIQQNLPTISEDANSPSRSGRQKKHVGFAMEEDDASSPSPTSVVGEETPFDELPSLADFSSTRIFDTGKKGNEKKVRKEEKKPQKGASLTYLINSIKKKVVTKVKAPKKLGDEEKYFPDSIREEGNSSKKFSANRCLLNEGEDGVNWDAD